MSHRKHAYVWVKLRGSRPEARKLQVSWTSKAERNRVVLNAVRSWGLGVWRDQNILVDVTTLDTGSGGRITINGETEPCCRFGLEPFVPKPEPVPGLFAAGAR